MARKNRKKPTRNSWTGRRAVAAVNAFVAKKRRQARKGPPGRTLERYIVWSIDADVPESYVDIVTGASAAAAANKVRRARSCAHVEETQLLDEYIKFLIEALARPLEQINKDFREVHGL